MLPGPQMNINNLHQHILGVAQEVILFQNVPGVQDTIHQLLQQQQQQLVGIGNRLNQLDNRLDQIDNRLNQLDNIQVRYGYISSANCACSPHLSLDRLPA